MTNELGNKLKRALEKLDQAAEEFKRKKANVSDLCRLDALRELVREQVPNENPMHSAREIR